MAPSKKKKKPVSNPARGVATISTVSKSKAQDGESLGPVLDPPDTEEDTVQLAQILSKSTVQKDFEKPLHELNPEELEKQLEESELQILVDTYGESTKKNASRQVSRLQTERRLLRPQADHLETRSWLPSELIQLIFDHVDAPYGSDESRGELSFYQIPSNLSEDDILVNIWTLYQLLPQIGFSEAQRDLVLRSLVGRKQPGTLRIDAATKDSVWGLEYCLDWLAKFVQSDDILGYEKQSGQPLNQRLRAHMEGRGTSASNSEHSVQGSPLDQPKTGSQAAIPENDKLNSSSEVASELESELDSDMEPDDMVRKYITLQTRRSQISPQDLQQQDRKSRQDARQQPRAGQVSGKTARLDSKLARIKSDILFDQEEADRQWAIIKIELARESAERKRLDIAKDTAEDYSNEPSNLPNIQPAISDDEDDGVLLGELFSSLPDTAANSNGGPSQMSVTDSAGTPIKVMDFGKWNGMSPRRVLEETCRARDSAYKIAFEPLSETTFSKRHAVRVEWSRPQPIAFSIPIDGVLCQIGDRRVEMRMDAVSCVNVIQSEGYISTIALFLIFESFPKEEKAHLRLPPVWKDLWNELRELRKLQSDELAISTLREIRALIAEESPPGQTIDKKESVLANGSTVIDRSVPFSLQNNDFRPTANAETLRSTWAAKASTSFYQTMLGSRKSLPIWDYKQDLLQAFNENQVVIVCGETGCGKSTQVPAYILEEELSNGRPCKVYCTEPRRISAISLARRVSEELGERRGDVGTSRSLVGYAIRLESQMTAQTRLVYATTGIVMRMLESSRGLDEVTHLVLDEVHERSIESDFLLIVLRKLMVKRPNLKVILMSATVDADRFAKYLDQAPVLTVPGRTFPVEIKFLEDAVEVTKFRDSDASQARVTDRDDEDEVVTTDARTTTDSSIMAYSAGTRETLAVLDEYRINYELIVRLLETIATSAEYLEYSKAVLIFLPGIAEIRSLNEMLIGTRTFTKGWSIHPLHSTIATDEQERAFLIPPPGVRKIVIATNIAETGITIPDVTCVIDAGKHKEMRFDERRQLSRLIESFISRANAKQRRGRAGRVQKGLCFHLFTKHRHDALMPEQQTPEILRLSLQDLVLRVKICKLGGIEQTLSEALDPPSAKNVRRAVDALIDVKALTAMEDLTPLGRQLARLPLDVFLGKLILLGTVFGCLDATLAIAAILSSKSPFSVPIGARKEADLARMFFKKGDSDLLTVYNAYCAWRRICSSNGMSEMQFCRKNFLSQQTLGNIEELKGQLLLSLVDAGFVTLSEHERIALNRVRSSWRQRNFVPIPPRYDTNCTNDLVIDSVIACSFYPKLLKRDGRGWRNVANNQSVSIHPSSVNKGVERPPRWLSFYHIMQSSNKFYNAHETSAVEDSAVALLCGDAEFKMYSGVIVIDGNRVRFSVEDWKKMLAIKTLRTQIRQIMTQSFKNPGRALSEQQKWWLDIWQKIFTVKEKKQTTI